MIRFIGGFICGVGALAAVLIGEHEPLPSKIVNNIEPPSKVSVTNSNPVTIPSIMDNSGMIALQAGVGPDDRFAPIRVDKNGHVICSKE